MVDDKDTPPSELEPLAPDLAHWVGTFVEETRVPTSELESATRTVLERHRGELSGAGVTSVGAKVGFGIVGLGAAVAGWLLFGPSEAPPREPPTARVERTTDRAPKPEPAPTQTEAVSNDPSAQALRAPTTVEASPAPSPSRSRSKAPRRLPKAASPPGSLREELALLGKARAALRARDAKTVLALVRRHGRVYPHSEFAEERSATEVMALCLLERTEQARRHAKRFRHMYPRSSFGAGLMRACEDVASQAEDP